MIVTTQMILTENYNFNFGDNNHNIPLEENYGFRKFKNQK